MLTLLAFALIAVFMALIMTKRLSVLTALILVPIAFALLAGFRAEIGPMMLDGIKALAPTGVMLLFAILYFSLMIDAGLFEPMVGRVVRLVGGDPVKICVGTAFLALLVSLDGDGSTTYLITTAAMLPLYQRLGMSRLMLASIIMQAGGVMNILPWGGPTARAAAALKVDAGELFVPLIPAMVVGAAWVVFVAWLFGRRERRRLGVTAGAVPADLPASADRGAEFVRAQAARRPRLFWFNLALTAALMVALVLGVLPLSILFMIACAVALVVNYPGVEEQRERIVANSGNVLTVVAVIFAAGIFTGILSGTKMIEAMAHSVVAFVPPGLGPGLAVITAVLSLPFTFFISNDAFYYGVVPVLASAAAEFGISPVEIGRASLIGQPVHLLSPLVPSTYLLVGLVGVELGDHQRFTLKWSAITCGVLLAVGLLTAVIPLVGRAL
ncbi:MAG: CitMHS family transporter [Verrucomicrobia bacterium]|nr:CitMHS family transporter [Verrucomicrobiota bacterium]